MKKILFLGACVLSFSSLSLHAQQAPVDTVVGLPADYTRIGVLIKQEDGQSKLRRFKRQQGGGSVYPPACLMLADSLFAQGYHVETVGGEGSYWQVTISKQPSKLRKQ